MAKNYSGMDTEELKALAEERQQRQAALNQLARSDPSAMKAMTANERQDFLKDQEKQRRDEWHQELHDARERRLDGMRQIAARDHGRYSHEVFAPTLSNGARAALAYLERQENRPERIREFDETQKTERIKASEHANGLINQGKTQAEIKAAAEREMSRNKDGWWDDQGNFHPGASVKAAEATGQWKSELNESNWQHRKDQTQIREEGRDRRQQQQIDAGRDKTDAWREEKELDRQANNDKANTRMKAIQERRDKQNALAEQRDFEKFLTDGFYYLSKEEKSAFRKMSPDEQREFWKKKVGREAGEEENPNIQTDKQGVKWEIVFDANGNKIGRKRVQ